MSANLRRLAFSQGSKKDLDTEQKLMERMRDVTVSMLHTAVHTVALYEARQSPGESTKGFAARVHGTKSNYNLVKLSVLQDSFFLDETGLLDSDTQERPSWTLVSLALCTGVHCNMQVTLICYFSLFQQNNCNVVTRNFSNLFQKHKTSREVGQFWREIFLFSASTAII